MSGAIRYIVNKSLWLTFHTNALPHVLYLMDLLQEVPPGKYALISVRQPKGQLINIRSQSALYARANQQPTMGRQFKVCTLKL